MPPVAADETPSLRRALRGSSFERLPRIGVCRLPFRGQCHPAGAALIAVFRRHASRPRFISTRVVRVLES